MSELEINTIEPEIDKSELVIKIDEYKFRLLYKMYLLDGNHIVNPEHGDCYVKIESYTENPTEESGIIFWVYQSKSELGLWRFCTCKDVKIKYKGPDYVQSTLIHLDLQNYININLSNIKYSEEEFNAAVRPNTKNKQPIVEDKDKLDLKLINQYGRNCPNGEDFIKKNGRSIDGEIDSLERMIVLAPFSTFKEELKCGEIVPDIKNRLKSFSNSFKQKYTAGTTEVVIPNYSNMFQNIIQVTGQIKRTLLTEKDTFFTKKNNSIYLYFLEASLCKISDTASSYDENIERVCSKATHYMPFLLTPIDSKCNYMGLYNKYIPSGSYICKLFDYSTGKLAQCTENENEVGRCDKTYSYIGSRYEGLFPFDDKPSAGFSFSWPWRQWKGGKSRRSMKTNMKHKNKNKKTRGNRRFPLF